MRSLPTITICLCATAALVLASCGPPGPAYLTTGRGPGDESSPSSRARRTPERTPRPRGATQPRASRPIRGDTAERCAAVLPLARQLARTHGVDVGLVMGIARIESRYNPRARNRRSGATGLMQIMPSTGRHFRCGDLSDATANLTCGVRILKRYLAYFDGEMTYGIAAYHAGPRSPSRARRAGRLPRNFSYVEKVLQTRSRFLRNGCH